MQSTINENQLDYYSHYRSFLWSSLSIKFSHIVTVDIAQFLNELWPVLAAHLNHRSLEAIMLHLQVASIGGHLESLAEVIPDSLRVSIGANHSDNQISLLLHVLHWHYKRQVSGLLIEFFPAVHDVVGQLNEGQRVLEQSRVSQVAILQDAVVEGAHYLYFLLVD